MNTTSCLSIATPQRFLLEHHNTSSPTSFCAQTTTSWGCCWEITLSPSHPTSPCADGISLKQGTAKKKKATHAHILRGLPPATLAQGFLLLHTALPPSKEPHSPANTLSSAGGTEVSVWHEECRENRQLAYLRAWHGGTPVCRAVQDEWVFVG